MKVFKGAICLISLLFMLSCSKKNNVQPTLTIPNGDFERWTSTNRLQSWTSNSCPECVPPYETYIVQKDSNAYHGKYAAKFIYNNVYAARAENKFYVSRHPATLTAYVMVGFYGADTVSIKIRLYKGTAKIDSGQWLGTSSYSQYTRIVIPVTQSSMQADSAKITITGGHMSSRLNTNTVFWVDDLMLQ